MAGAVLGGTSRGTAGVATGAGSSPDSGSGAECMGFLTITEGSTLNQLIPDLTSFSDRAPTFVQGEPAYARQSVRIRQPCGTQKDLLTVAFFRTWRGSQASAAQDPTVITYAQRQSRQAHDRGREFNPA